MADTIPLPERVPAQEYMMNLMVDGDEEDDVRLHLASLCGDSIGLKQLLGECSSKEWLNYRVRPYMSPPLRLAVSGGNCECIELLLDAGAEIDLEDVKGQTPLFVATSCRKVAIMKVLLERGANPDGSRKNRCTPLLIAVRDGFSEGVKLLLKYGADTEPFDHTTCIPGWPLQHSIVYAHFSCFFELIRGGALPNLTSLSYPIKEAVIARLSVPHAILKYAKDFPEFVRLYHEAGGNLCQINTSGVPPLEANFESSPAKDALESLTGVPLSLKSLCRLCVRHQLSKEMLHSIPCLEVPSSLIPFLNFEEFYAYTIRTKENTHEKIIEKEV
ncbi:ankyrin repeat and SOCS box protein 1-like [Palaemon carinicauda]|uniref:ankyrin repeat and SOCS box protein 1-like n=1 Tax=Palaemon carinicauda TaxID=392227 RepID=UPI0035B5DAAF